MLSMFSAATWPYLGTRSRKPAYVCSGHPLPANPSIGGYDSPTALFKKHVHTVNTKL